MISNLTDPIVLLTNGVFPTHDIPLHAIDNARSIVCCDGAVEPLIKYGKRPQAIVGDLDSIPLDLKYDLEKILVHIPDQNENDLRKALMWINEQGVNKVTILGATGKREDHSIGNIFTLLQFPINLELHLLTDYGEFSICTGKKEFESYKGQPVSIFSLNPKIEITSTNLKYSLNHDNLNTLYSGSLNESISDHFTIKASSGSLLIYTRYVQ